MELCVLRITVGYAVALGVRSEVTLRIYSFRKRNGFWVDGNQRGIVARVFSRVSLPPTLCDHPSAPCALFSFGSSGTRSDLLTTHPRERSWRHHLRRRHLLLDTLFGSSLAAGASALSVSCYATHSSQRAWLANNWRRRRVILSNRKRLGTVKAEGDGRGRSQTIPLSIFL